MNYFLPPSIFDDKKSYLSDKLSTKAWRSLRALHIKNVNVYEHDDILHYQCSNCNKYHKTVDLHDNWYYEDNKRILLSVSNLCFKCHALEHLEKIYLNSPNVLKTGAYRGVEIKDLVGILKNHYEHCNFGNYENELKKVFEEIEELKKYDIIYNDYTLIKMVNQVHFTKNPILI